MVSILSSSAPAARLAQKKTLILDKSKSDTEAKQMREEVLAAALEEVYMLFAAARLCRKTRPTSTVSA